MGRMEDKLNEFLTATGALIELWGVTYKGFLAQGFDHKTALAHTQAFIQTLLTVSGTMGNTGKEK